MRYHACLLYHGSVIMLLLATLLAVPSLAAQPQWYCNDDGELLLQYRCTQTLAVDIHPAARIGKGVLLDHGTGLVIGETAVVGNNVSILHNVTLGGKLRSW